MSQTTNLTRTARLCAVVLAIALAIALTSLDANARGFKIGGDVGKTLRHIDKEKNRAGKNLEEAAHATGKFAENQAHSVGDTAKAFEERMREGKPLDAVWHVQSDLLKASGKNTLKAMQDSSALRTLGQIAATVAGGAAGAAAFNGAYVGFTAKDVGAGFKAGVIAGATTVVSSAISKAPVESLGDAASKAAASGVVGGAATAASGGKFEDGFANAAAASAAHSIYKNTTKVDPDPRPGTEWIAKGNAAQCNGINGCRAIETADDMRAVDSRLKATGKFNPKLGQLLQNRQEHPIASILKSPAYEGSFVMDTANKIPYVQAGSYFHDTLLFKNEVVNVLTIPPAMVFTGIAGGAGRDAAMLKQAEKDAKR